MIPYSIENRESIFNSEKTYIYLNTATEKGFTAWLAVFDDGIYTLYDEPGEECTINEGEDCRNYDLELSLEEQNALMWFLLQTA